MEAGTASNPNATAQNAEVEGMDAAAPVAVRNVTDLPRPRGVPGLGNSLQIDSRQYHRVLESWAREFGPMYRFSVGRKQIVAISDGPLIASLLRDRPDALRRSSRTSNMLAELGTTGVFSAEGEEWRKQRRLVMKALTPEVVKNFFPTLTALTERLRVRWQQAIAAGRTPNVLRDLKAWTLDVTIALAMGKDINTLEHDANPLQRDVETIFARVARRLTKPIAYWRYVRLPVDREADAAAKRINVAVSGFVAEARERLAANPGLRVKPGNLLEALVAARDEPGSEFSDANVIGNAVTMVFAGEDTTSNTIAWLLDFVARDAAVAAALAEEGDTVLGEDAVLKRFSALEEFPYLDACMNEAMRLKPVAPFLALETNREMVVGDVQMDKGQLMMILMRQAGRLPAEFPAIDEFRPQRWLAKGGEHGLAKKDDPARKLFPFGGGPRFCPGRYLAIAEVKMVVSMIARNFNLQSLPGAPPVTEMFTFTMTPSALPVGLAVRGASPAAGSGAV